MINADKLDALVRARILEKPRSEWLHEAQAAGLPFGIVQTAEDLLRCPQLNFRGYFPEVDHPEIGSLRYPGRPFPVSGTQDEPIRPAPTLGQHNSEILGGELGYAQAELKAFASGGVI
jgi:crotonobetainyl-CoA:carnitine CoA-transferase CaiB-like acyl-CoA transferase